MTDLEVLERERNFGEFLMHVNDIRPSERSSHWKGMYQKMAMSLVDYKIKTGDFSQKSYKQIEQIGRSSTMINDEFFQLRRSLYAKKYFTNCFRKASQVTESSKNTENYNLCETELTTFWMFSKKDPDFGLDIATIIETYKSTYRTWPFYELAIKDLYANIYCKKSAVQKAVIKKLYEDTYSPNFNDNYKNLINKSMSENCFEELVYPLKETLTSIESSGLEKEMALSILESKGKLSADEIELFAILFLLDGPVVGDKMNIAWKKVELLSENYSKRQKILAQIKNLPLIPDKIFKDPNLPRHKAIINLFAKNFPEYLDYYGTTCLKYISNTGTEVLNVSSSYQCNEFLKAAKAQKIEQKAGGAPWVSDTVEMQYSALRK